MEAKIRCIVPWFGSKRSMAPEIVRQLGPHRCYWEPFCGSMAVLLAKPEVSQETVNDLHGDLINLGRVIQSERWGSWLYRKLRRQFVSEEVFREHAEVMKSSDWADEATGFAAAQRALHYFYSSWMGRNGVIGTKGWNNNFCVRYTMNGGIQGTRFAAAVDSIPAWRRRMREVTILRRDGFALIEKIEDAKAVAIYVDPPYIEKGAEYVHDFKAEDHGRLADLLRRFKKARVVVSYYDHPQLAKLYPKWTKLDCSRAKSMSVQGQRGAKSEKAPEVLLINGAAVTEPIPEKAGLFS